VHIGARGKDDRTLERFVDVRIGLQMRDQFGIGVDIVANAGAAERLDLDRRCICADPKICGLCPLSGRSGSVVSNSRSD
jgi:hypothetical protein